MECYYENDRLTLSMMKECVNLYVEKNLVKTLQKKGLNIPLNFFSKLY